MELEMVDRIDNLRTRTRLPRDFEMHISYCFQEGARRFITAQAYFARATVQAKFDQVSPGSEDFLPRMSMEYPPKLPGLGKQMKFQHMNKRYEQILDLFIQ